MKNLLQVFAVCIPLVATAVSCYDDSELRGKIETLENTTIAGIKSQISKLESKDAELKDKIDALEKSQASKEEINVLKAKDTEIENKISDLKAWAEDLFKNYYTKEEIDIKINAINVAISELDKALKALEERVKVLEDKLVKVEITLTYPQGNVCLSGTSVEITYTLENADEKTEVYAMVDGLWSAKVVPTDYKSGNIVVILPDAAYGYNTDANVVVFVNKGGIVSTKAFAIEAGVITNCDNTGIELGWQEGTFTFNFSSNFDYLVDINCDWIEVISTKASVVEHSASFSYTENPEDNPARYGVVNLRTPSGDVFCSINVMQSPQPASDPIVFADKNVEKICVDRFDTNGDGVVTMREAASYESIYGKKNDIASEGGFFREYQSFVVSFDELKYFTSIKVIPGDCFHNCGLLKSITLPDSVNELGGFSFAGCTKLQEIILPENTTVIGEYAFASCSSITSFIVTRNVNHIGDNAFMGCSNLKTIDILSLEISNIPRYCFDQCYELTSITLPNQIKTINEGAFINTFKLSDITLPKDIEVIEAWAFYNTQVSSIILPSNIKFIGQYAFTLSNTSYCYAPEPPLLGLNALGKYGKTITLYVPKDSVEAYKASDWMDYCVNILPIK